MAVPCTQATGLEDASATFSFASTSVAAPSDVGHDSRRRSMFARTYSCLSFWPWYWMGVMTVNDVTVAVSFTSTSCSSVITTEHIGQNPFGGT